MKPRSLLGMAMAGAAFCAGFAARPSSAAEHSAFVAPRSSPLYAERLARLPDFTGSWRMYTPPQYRAAYLMFDPAHTYVPPDPGKALNVGPLAGSRLTGIPLNPEYGQEYGKRIEAQLNGSSSDGVAVGCRPYGMPRVMSGVPFAPDIVVTPDVVVMISDVETRRIYTDGRGHPTGDDAVSSWDGHSVGRWEGDTLVVDTVNVFAGNYDQTDAPHSNKIHVVERIHLVDRDILQNDMTIEDPVTLTKPWQVTRQYKRAAVRWEEKVYSNCGEEEAVEMVGGQQHLVLPFEKVGK